MEGHAEMLCPVNGYTIINAAPGVCESFESV